MKFFLLPAALLLTLSPGWGAETAYTALRVYGKQNGVESLNHIVELRGRGGAPAPDSWRITTEDAAARGGVKEVEMQHGHVVSERTPVGKQVGSPMNFTHLNLDSDGVFTIADQEAKKTGVTFDHVDYTLQSGAAKGSPVWRVELSKTGVGRVCTYEIAADTGAVLRTDAGGADPALLPPPPAEPLPPGARVDVHDERDSDPDDAPPGAYPGQHLLNHIRRHFEKRSRQFENFFTGRGWSKD